MLDFNLKKLLGTRKNIIFKTNTKPEIRLMIFEH